MGFHPLWGHYLTLQPIPSKKLVNGSNFNLVYLYLPQGQEIVFDISDEIFQKAYEMVNIPSG